MEVGAETKGCLEAPQPAAALVATFHTVPPTLRCLTCLSAAVRALTTLAAPPENPMTLLEALLEEAAPKPKVSLQGVTPSSLRSQRVGFRTLPPRLSVSLIAETSTTVLSMPARSSVTLKELMTVLETVIWHILQKDGSRRVWKKKHVTLAINTPLMSLVLSTHVFLETPQRQHANVQIIQTLLV